MQIYVMHEFGGWKRGREKLGDVDAKDGKSSEKNEQGLSALTLLDRAQHMYVCCGEVERVGRYKRGVGPYGQDRESSFRRKMASFNAVHLLVPSCASVEGRARCEPCH